MLDDKHHGSDLLLEEASDEELFRIYRKTLTHPLRDPVQIGRILTEMNRRRLTSEFIRRLKKEGSTPEGG